MFQPLLLAGQFCPSEPGKREKRGNDVPQVFQLLVSLHQIITYSPFRGFKGGKDSQGFLVLSAKGYVWYRKHHGIRRKKS